MIFNKSTMNNKTDLDRLASCSHCNADHNITAYEAKKIVYLCEGKIKSTQWVLDNKKGSLDDPEKLEKSLRTLMGLKNKAENLNRCLKGFDKSSKREFHNIDRQGGNAHSIGYGVNKKEGLAVLKDFKKEDQFFTAEDVRTFQYLLRTKKEGLIWLKG